MSFSPDARALVGIVNSQLAIIDIATGAMTSPMYTGNQATNPDWSPSGEEIVYERVFYTTFPPQPVDSAGVHVFSLKSGMDRPLFAGGAVVPGHQPRWSRDGIQIAYITGPAFDSLLAIDTTDAAPKVLATATPGCNIAHFRWIHSILTGLNGIVYMQNNGASYYADRTAGGTRRIIFAHPFEDFSPTGGSFVFIGSNPRDSVGVLFTEAIGDYSGASRMQLTRFVDAMAQAALGQR